MDAATISIKGTRQGLLVSLGSGAWSDRLGALEARLSENGPFFRGGRIALDVGSLNLGCAEIEGARELLARHNVELVALVSENRDTEAAAQELGLVIRFDLKPLPDSGETAGGVEENSFEGWVVRRTLRSGQVLRYPGHIVVIGDVNPGAEVVAGGDIVIWGKVRGVVHAGALAGEGAVVCALDLAPMQLRIAGHIVRSPEEKRRRPMPEMALVREGQVVAVPWRQ